MSETGQQAGKKTHFDASWIQWIETNVSNGCDKDGIFKILLDEGYDYNAIVAQMNYQPSIPAFMLVNPLKQQQVEAQQQTQSHAQPSVRFLPNAVAMAEDKAEFYLLEDFLNPEECAELVMLIKSQLRPSTLSSEEADHQFRTSSTCDLGAIQHPLVQDIDQRICRYLGIHPSYSESIQGQHYEVGQEFKPHTDYFEQHELDEYGGAMGQRTYTMMIYLNNVTEGGETVFPRLDISCKPNAGTAVIWNSLDHSGTPNFNTLHHATQVRQGTKTVITKWFRQHSAQTPAPAESIKEANEFIPNYTRLGLHQCNLLTDLFEAIQTFYRGDNSLKDEFVPGDFIASESHKVPSSLKELPDALRQRIHAQLKPMLEDWAGVALEPTYVYGIRIYHRGAQLKAHRDRLETHIISVIINVDQQVEQDWPLLIEDNMYRLHRIVLKPGEMVFYEGGRLLHGRPEALNGSAFANIFCHFKPVGYRHPNLQRTGGG